MTAAPIRTVPAVLERFESTFAEFITAFNHEEYVLWLGSGISRERVPNLADLLERILEHLRSNIVDGKPDCEYRTALGEILQLANLSTTELQNIDLSVAVDKWPLKGRIVTTLVPNYSRVLDVSVGNHPADYLVWTALDVPNTYGSPDLEPDVEHYCIAILMLEGLISSAITANWDGLLEKALNELTPSFDSLVRVAVRPEDFRGAKPHLEVIKFHGCAVRARKDEAKYRDRLIARQSQISQWTVKPENQLMRQHLEVMYADRLTLMLGLSAQDANLHTIFAGAIQNLARPWPASAPSVVLSEEQLEAHHSHILRITYGSNHQGNAQGIAQSALLGSYGKPTLLALVLSSLTEKLSFLIHHEINGILGSGAVKELQTDLLHLRDVVARHADPDDPDLLKYEEVLEFQRTFTARLINVANFLLKVFRTGRPPRAGEGHYEPISVQSAAQSVLNADYPSKQFGRLGVALALVGRGMVAGQWSAAPGHTGEAGDGVMKLVTSHRNARVFFVKDARALTQLAMEGLFDESDGNVLVVVADEEPMTQTRSPKSRFGRDGKTQAGRFNVASGLAGTTSVDDLHEAFVLAGGF